jgi:hypothetical protein
VILPPLAEKNCVDIGTGTGAAQGSGKRDQSRAKNTSSERKDSAGQLAGLTVAQTQPIVYSS